MNLIHDRHLRGQTRLGWLDSFHTFSFGDFQDASRTGFRSLRAINETQIVPGSGEFADQFHRNLEIFTYVLAGELEHEDDLGNRTRLRPGEAQVLSTGTGIWHKDINPAAAEMLRCLQVWIAPAQRDQPPRYARQSPVLEPNRLQRIADPEGAGGLPLRQDANLYVAVLDAGLTYTPPPDRFTWIQIVNGIAFLDGEELRAGDGVQLVDRSERTLETAIGAEILLFDLA